MFKYISVITCYSRSKPFAQKLFEIKLSKKSPNLVIKLINWLHGVAQCVCHFYICLW